MINVEKESILQFKYNAPLVEGMQNDKLNAIPIVVLSSDLNKKMNQIKNKPFKRALTNDEILKVSKKIKVTSLPRDEESKKKDDVNENDCSSGIRILSSRILSKHMEKAKEIVELTADKLCRICGRYDNDLTPIFSELSRKRRIPYVINKYLPIMISKDEERLPSNICLMCVSYLVDWQCLIERCQTTDDWLHKMFKVPNNIKNVAPLKCVSEENVNNDSNNSEYKSSNNEIKVDKVMSLPTSDFDHNYYTNTWPLPAEENEKDCMNDITLRNDTVEYSTPNSTVNATEFTIVSTNKTTESVENGNTPVNSMEENTNVNSSGVEIENDCNERSKRETTNSSNVRSENSVLLDVDKQAKRKTRYKVFSVCVCDKDKEIHYEENMHSDNTTDDHCGSGDFDCKVVNKSELNSINERTVCTESIPIGDMRNIEQDDNSRDTPSLSYDEMMGDNVNDSNNGALECTLNGSSVTPPAPASSDRYIEKQRYKVGITLVKRQKQKGVNLKPVPSKRRNLIDVNIIDKVSIVLTKQNKLNCKQFMKTFKYSKQTYSRLSAFTCQHCVCYPMTANEFGKHLKSFHPDQPLRCPVCKKVFQKDYNLIIHLQVTACSRMIGESSNDINKKDNSGSDNSLPDDTGASGTPEPDGHDFNLAFKILPRPEGNICDDDCIQDECGHTVFNVEYIGGNDESISNKHGKDNLFHEITIETWEPSTSFVIFEPGFIVLDTTHYFDYALEFMIMTEIGKLLNMEMLSLFDCNALRMIMGTKVSKILNKLGNDKIIKIKSVISKTTEEKNDPVIEPVSERILIKQRTPVRKVFRPLKKLHKGRPSLKDLYSANPRTKAVARAGRQKVESKQRTCDECNMKFLTSKNMWKHKKLYHTEVKCDHCNEMFSCVKVLKQHKKEQERDSMLSCETCSLKFYKKDNLKKHNLLVHNIGEFINCDSCSKRFVSKISLYCHKKNVHGNDLHLCPYCGQMYKTPAALRCHIRDRHMNLTRNFVCTTCNKSFKSSQKLKAHMLRHSDNREVFRCPVCDRKFYSKDTVKQHQELHLAEPAVYCVICGTGYHRTSRLPVHLKAVHWTSVNKCGDEQFPCLVCNVMLEDGESLSQHMMFHSEDDKIKEVGGDIDGKVKCLTCNKYLPSKKDAALHTFYVHEDLPFKCSYMKECQRKFWSKAALDEHEVNEHNRLINSCPSCNQVFRSVKKKQAHIRKAHSDEVKPHVCSVCDKSFRSAYTLNRHNVIHSDIKQFSCEMCGRCFSLPQILAKHVLWHKRQEQKYKEEDAAAMNEATCKSELQDTDEYQGERTDCYEEVGEEEVIGYEEIQEDGIHHGMEFVDSDLLVQHQDVQSNVKIVNTSVVVGEVVSVCTVYKCTKCNIIFNIKPEFDQHCIDYHNIDRRDTCEYEPGEVLEISMVQSDMY